MLVLNRKKVVSCLSFLTICIMASFSKDAFSQQYVFDPSLFLGSDGAVDLSRLNEKDIPIKAGLYNVDLYVNGHLVKESTPIKFSAPAAGGDPVPCLSVSDIRLIELKPDAMARMPDNESCMAFSKISSASSWTFDMASLKLSLLIPQALLNRQPRGYIPVDQWDAGVPVLFLKHTSNYYETHNDGGYKTRSFWSGITSGTNLGLWQLRNQSNFRYMDVNGKSRQQWTSVKTYAQRPLSALNSVMTLGDSYTNSSLFGSLSYNGLKLVNDNKMYPQGKRGYAPEVRGVANTTARVVVKQLGKIIYETVVSPGAFVIDDLNNTHGQGDLQVTVIEANGQQSSFTVPYSAVPDSVRPGQWNYELALGHVRNYSNTDNKFLEGVLQKGISNRLTANSGIRLAKDYEAYLLGGVLATSYGAFSLNATYSDALVQNDTRETGWRAEGSYSRTFSTGTNVTLAAYRYSTKGFRDLQDVLGVRKYTSQGETYYSDTLNQKNKFSALVSQSFPGFGSLSLNASTSNYYNNRSRITQFQLGYSNSYKKISYSVNVGRQRTTYSTRNYYYSDIDDDRNRQIYTENTASISVSMPFDWGGSRSSVTTNYTKNNTTETATTSLSGSAGERGNLAYSVYSGVEAYQDNGNKLTWGASLQDSTSKGTLRASYSQGNGYKQLGMGTSGTLVIHSGGLTYGPYVSDTFALVKAKGAAGAKLKNGQGAKIDSFGYALYPSLTPYRYNSVSIDPKDMNLNVDIDGGSRQVVPYAGAVLRVEFETIAGKPVLINSVLSEGGTIPMGAEVSDKDGKIIGMVGQGEQIYARLNDQSGTLFVSWGKNGSSQCRINYQLPSEKPKDGFVQLNLPCVKA